MNGLDWIGIETWIKELSIFHQDISNILFLEDKRLKMNTIKYFD
jgi:hypothetical protein